MYGCLTQVEVLLNMQRNTIQADTRIWWHATQCESSNILIYSPDTAVYNIGLGFISQLPTATYIIQLNMPYSDESKYINLKKF